MTCFVLSSSSFATEECEIHFPPIVGSFDSPSFETSAVVVSGTYAYVTDPTGWANESGLWILDISNPSSPFIVGSVHTPGSAGGVAVSGSYAYMADGSLGLQVIDVSNPYAPFITDTVDTPGTAVGVAVSGTYAYVADGYFGLQVIDISDPYNTSIIRSIDTPSGANGVAVSGFYAYIADSYSGLQIVEISNPLAPAIVGAVDTPDNAIGVAVSGSFAYVADGASGLQIVDISDPSVPYIIKSVDTPGEAHGVAVSGTYAYVGDNSFGLQIVDVSDPSASSLVGSAYISVARGVAISGTYAYVTDDAWGLKIVDVSSPYSPFINSSISIVSQPDMANGLAVAGNYAYVTAFRQGLKVVDISDPSAPFLVATVDTPGYANDVALSGDYAYVADGDFGLQIIDISNPLAPFIVGSVDTPGYADDIAISWTHAYVADGNSGLQVVNISNPAVPIMAGSVATANYAQAVAVSWTYAYVAVGNPTLQVVDISNPSAPYIVGSVDTPGGAHDIAVSGAYAYIADGTSLAGMSYFQIIDVFDPTTPSVVASLIEPGQSTGIAVSGMYAYITDDWVGLRIVDISNPYAPLDVGSLATPSGAAMDIAIAGSHAYVTAGRELTMVQLCRDQTREAVPLILGTPVDITAQPGHWADFYVDVPAGTSVLLQLSGEWEENASFYFYFDYTDMPTHFSFDGRLGAPNAGPVYELLVPASPNTRRIYVSAYNRLSTTTSATISAIAKEKHVSHISIGTGGDTGEVSFIVSGLGFVPTGMQAELVCESTSIEASSATLVSPTELLVSFHLPDAPLCDYDLRITWPTGETETLAAAFTVTAGIGPVLEASLQVPGSVRPGRTYTLYVKYANVGDADMVPPIFVVESVENARMRLSSNDPLETGPAQVLGINLDGYGGVLSPGTSWGIPVVFEVPPGMPGHSYLHFNLSVMDQADSPINWEEVEAEVRPPDVDPEVWNRLWPILTAQIGSTWRDYQQALAADAGYLSTLDRYVYSVRDLFRFEIEKALSMNPRAYLAGQLDAYCPSPGLPLALGRLFPNGMDKRLYQGAFGLGWTHTYDIYLEQLADGDMSLHEANGFTRFFHRNADGTYSALVGDYGRLTSDGSTFTLTEKDQTVYHFRIDLRLEYIQDLNGNRISASYNEMGQLTGLAHSSGKSFQIGYNPQGHISIITDHAGRVTTYEYDALGEHLLSVTAPGNRVTSYTYNGSTGVPDDNALVSITYPNGSHQYYQYDGLGRLTEEHLDGNAEQITYTYDDFGRVTIHDLEGGSVTISPDEYGQPGRTTDSLGRTVKTEYGKDFNLSQVTHPAWGDYNLTYDHLGNVVAMRNPLGHVVNLAYDTRFSALALLQDALGNKTSFLYDDEGNLQTIAYADTSAESFVYDALGNVITYTNRRGNTITYQYNSAGQILRKDYSDGRWITYVYDTIGRLEEVTDPSGTISLDYDDRDFLTRIEYPSGHWFSFSYNNAGQRTHRVGDDGYMLKYFYDAVGRLERLTDGSDNLLIQYIYDDAGRLIGETKGNGTYTTFDYDLAGQLLSMVNYSPEDAAQSRFNYTYDENGNRTSMTTLEGTTEYEYDAIGQLVGVTYPNGDTEEYEYDAAGNRIVTTESGMTTEYTTNNMNQYTQVGDATYTYDADGNMTSKADALGSTTYEYDMESRLIRVVAPPDGTWEYTYDALGNRTAVTHDGVITRYVQDPIGLVDIAAEYDGTGELQARYVHGLGLIARIDSGGDPAYYSFDAIGNTRQLTNAIGGVVNTYDYSPFGKVRQKSETIPNKLRFIGRFGIMEEEVGLTLMRSRYYNPDIGRFITEDPLKQIGDTNLYRYVSNQPTRWTDPLGLFLYGDYASTGVGFRDIGRDYGVGVVHFDTNNPENAGFYQYLGVYELALCAGGSIGHTFAVSHKKGASWYGFSRHVDINLRLLSVSVFWNKEWFGVNIGVGLGVGAGLGTDLYGRPFPATPPRDCLPMTGLDYIPSMVILPWDPNEKVGPTGEGLEGYVSITDTLTYVVYFENLAIASAPAQEVFVDDYLDPDLDWSTLKVEEIAFGSHIVPVAEFADRFYSRETVDPWWVDVSAELNNSTGHLSVVLRTLDPETGELPEDALAGFLPPEDGTGRGQGHVRFSVRPKATLAAGTLITNNASIVFDTNPPMDTNTVSNTIAGLLPQIPTNPLPQDGAVRISRNTALNWADSLHASKYDVYFGVNADPPLYHENLAVSYSALAILDYGKTYHWKIIAKNDGGDSVAGPEWIFTTKTSFEEWIDQFALIPLDQRGLNDDPDADGLTNQVELALETSPDNADTDNDGVDDYEEAYVYGTEPTNPDSDGDGLNDSDELFFYGTDPLDADTDSDGMPDGWEVSYPDSLDPFVDDSTVDYDQDGFTNLEEYQGGTNPTIISYSLSMFASPAESGSITGGGLYDSGQTATLHAYANSLWGFDHWEGDSIAGSSNNPEYLTMDGNKTVTAAFVRIYQTYYVPDNYSTIQDALDACMDGDTVIVRDGTYSGMGNKNLDFKGKAVTLRSENGPSNSIIDCALDGRGFIFHSGEISDSVVEGFTIMNGSVSGAGGGIYCEGSSPTVSNCILKGNWADIGSGIFCVVSDPTIMNCAIIGNAATSGGGIFSDMSSPYIVNCTVSDNVAEQYGGGMSCDGGSSPTITNSILWNNSALYGAEIALTAVSYPSSLAVSFSNMKGGETGVYVESGCDIIWDMLSNIDADPLFVGGGDYHLRATSPCINAGIDVAIQSDIDGEDRPHGDGCDMGSDEYYGIGDPVIAASVDYLENSCLEGESAPDQSFLLWNSGGGMLSYWIADEADWYECLPPDGHSIGEIDTVTVYYDSDLLSAGEYSGAITISDDANPTDVKIIPVTLKVTGLPQTMTFTSIGAHDGTVLESEETSEIGGSNNSTVAISTALRVGDEYDTLQGERQYKAIVSFDTSIIPDGATILSATLKLTGGGLKGTNPLTTHGPLYVDIIAGSFSDNPALENADFQASATAMQVATMSKPLPGSRISTGNLDSAGLAAINEAGLTQLRVYFFKDDNDNNSDWVGCYSGDSSIPENRPQLELIYQD